MPGWTIRNATADDMVAVAQIYAPHVSYGTATFEEVPPTPEEMRRRFGLVTDAGLVWLVAENGQGEILGYAYASPYRERAAYRYSIETSVYLSDAAQGQGLGFALMEALLNKVAVPPMREVIAVVGDSANAASINLHKKLGFDEVGTLQGVGFKFGRAIDTVILQKRISQKSV